MHDVIQRFMMQMATSIVSAAQVMNSHNGNRLITVAAFMRMAQLKTGSEANSNPDGCIIKSNAN